MEKEITLETQREVAEEILSLLLPHEDRATILVLSGELGAGKTTFTQALAKLLGIKPQVISPTFTLMKGYPLSGERFTMLFHIDAYRLEDPKELAHLGWKDIQALPRTLIVLEWPEKVAPLLPPHIAQLSFTVLDEKTRAISFHPEEE